MDLFKYPTIERLADHIRDEAGQVPPTLGAEGDAVAGWLDLFHRVAAGEVTVDQAHRQVVGGADG
jgi:hypothetical protein